MTIPDPLGVELVNDIRRRALLAYRQGQADALDGDAARAELAQHKITVDSEADAVTFGFDPRIAARNGVWTGYAAEATAAPLVLPPARRHAPTPRSVGWRGNGAALGLLGWIAAAAFLAGMLAGIGVALMIGGAP